MDMKHVHRLAALLLGACLALGLAAPAGAVSASARLETIQALGIMTGDENGNMNLSASVTRAEFVKMMVAASPYKDSVGDGYGASLFKDVKSGHWASGYIKLAVEQEWVTGYVDGTFRPDATITLEEGCTALLRLLGYGSDSLTGSYPTAQLSKARAVGLLDSLALSQGNTLTRQDCVTLFYDLLTAEDSGGAIYGTTLGYTVTNGEVDYSDLVAAGTKGPYVADGGELDLPFSTSDVTVYYNGALSGLSAVEEHDVYYYNEDIRTIWVYHDRASGTLTAVSPSQAAPTSVTVAGVSYDIGTSSAAYQLSSQGSFSPGDVVTLLLGMNGEVVEVIDAREDTAVYYGVVVSSERSGSSSSTSSSGSASVQTVTQIACTDGALRTVYHSGGQLSAGRLAQVSYAGGEAAVKGLSTRALSGTVSGDGTRLAGYDLADDVAILDTDGNGNYVRIYPSRIAGARLQGADVRYYSLDKNGDIDQLILYEVTGDTYTYAYVTRAEGGTSGLSSSGSYTYILNGETGTITGSAVYNVSAGGAAIGYSGGQVESLRQLQPVELDRAGTLTARGEDGEDYVLDEGVQVLLRDGRGLYAVELEEVTGGDYVLTGWYDAFGFSAGGRIRLIVAEEK